MFLSLVYPFVIVVLNKIIIVRLGFVTYSAFILVYIQNTVHGYNNKDNFKASFRNKLNSYKV